MNCPGVPDLPWYYSRGFDDGMVRREKKITTTGNIAIIWGDSDEIAILCR